MSSRLEYVQKWEVLAERAGYKPSELAALCQISLRTLERHFQKNYGVTVGQWLREIRLNAAYRGLVAGKTVKEVAYDQGYKQISHFSREFKNQFGCAPSFLSASRGVRTIAYRQVSPTSNQMIFKF